MMLVTPLSLFAWLKTGICVYRKTAAFRYVDIAICIKIRSPAFQSRVRVNLSQDSCLLDRLLQNMSQDAYRDLEWERNGRHCCSYSKQDQSEDLEIIAPELIVVTCM